MFLLLEGTVDFHVWQEAFESEVMALTDQAQDNDPQNLLQILEHQRESLRRSEETNRILRAELGKEIVLGKNVMKAYIQLRRSASSAEEAQAPPWRSGQGAEPTGRGMSDNDNWWRSSGWWNDGRSEQHST